MKLLAIFPLSVFSLMTFLLLAGCVSHSEGRRMAGEIQSKMTFGKYFYDADPIVLSIQPLESGEQLKICLIRGGTSSQIEGAVGLFGPHGKILDQVYIRGLMDGYLLQSTNLIDESPRYFVLSVMERYGPGDWDQSLIVLSAYKNRLIEVWRGSGDALRASANTFHRHAGLLLMDLDDDASNELVSVNYVNLSEGTTPTGAFQTEAFRFDPAKLHFVPMINPSK